MVPAKVDIPAHARQHALGGRLTGGALALGGAELGEALGLLKLGMLAHSIGNLLT
jgi:hypothetical protein